MSSVPADTAAADQKDPDQPSFTKDPKSHTFRKRRLSLPLHHLNAGDDLPQLKKQALGETPKHAFVSHKHIENEHEEQKEDNLNTFAHTKEEQEDPDLVYGKEAPPEDDGVDYGYGDDSAPPDDDGVDYGYGDEDNQKPKQLQQTLADDNQSHHSHNSHHSMHSYKSEADEKAHTFRKRRLSLTSNNSGAHSHGSNNNNNNNNNNMGAPDQISRRNRRSSFDSACSGVSFGSDGTGTHTNNSNSGGKPVKFVSRTLHADELLPRNGMPPPSPAVNSDNVLYHQKPLPPLSLMAAAAQNGGNPFLIPSLYGGFNQQNRPKWQRRQTLCHQTESEKMPFNVDVVGTYSCHGVEPVYDSEYDDEDEDEMPIISMPTTAAKINQDRGGIVCPYGNHPQTALFAVYDGHGQGGEHVSQYALHEIQRRLEKHSKFRSDIETAIKETFVAVDESLKKEPLIDPLFAGTTACVALLQKNKLTLANAGDSRAVLARRNFYDDGSYSYVSMDLTKDQNPDVPEEMERIIRSGGYVSLPPAPGLSARVWLDPGCTQIGLAMARSIGDHAVSQSGVIAEPVVSYYEVTENDEFLILASDGVWEFLTSAQAVQIVGENFDRGATKACQALIEAAAARWHEEEGAYRDDITAIVIKLQEVWRTSNNATTEKKSSETNETENSDNLK